MRMVHTVRHVRPHQLLYRLHATLRRAWRVRRAERFRARLMDAALPPLAVSGRAPKPVFPPRCHLAALQGGDYTLTFLNAARTFTHPITWHPPGLEADNHLWLFHLHYMEFLEALPDEAFVAVVDDWIAHVPPYRPRYWLSGWSSYVLSIRCVVWMQQFAERRRRLPAAFQKRMLASLVRQLRFLERNLERDVGGNHLIKNIKALLWAGRFWDHAEAGRWRTLGERLLVQELDEQILPDGMHYERSPAYHTQVFADLVECFAVLDDGPARERLRAVLRPMAQALADLTHPDGHVSLFNDGGLHMAYCPAACLKAWTALTHEHVRQRRAIALEAAGYYGLRAGDDYVLVDGGKVAPDFLTAHGHGDIFSFEWTIAAKRFIVDAGVYEYTPGARRAYARSTRAHNTLTLDGLDQCEFWSSFRMARRARVKRLHYEVTADGFTFTGAHDGYRRLAGGPIHERTTHVRPGRIEVRDWVEGGAGQCAEARLLLHPGCTVEEQGGVLLLRREDVAVRLVTEAAVQVEPAPWFPDFGVERPSRRLVLHYGEAPCNGAFRLERVR
ncbi:MAG: alginate lyase family protein [Rhodothermales bacterium]|nr:alginate lyase family protein [Rhodothermales bacterium]